MVVSFDLNIAAVIAAAVLSMVIGHLWYSPFAFGEQWMKLSGIRKNDMKKMKGKMWMSYAGMFIMSFISVLVLSLLVRLTTLGNPVGGALMGFLVWIGFVATTSAAGVLWSGKPKELYFIENGHHMISLIISGIILSIWA